MGITEDIFKIIDIPKNQEYISYMDTEGNIRVIKIDEKYNKEINTSDKNNEWIDLSRINIFTNPSEEWNQIFNESWKLQKNFFWKKKKKKFFWGKKKKKKKKK